MAPSFIMRRQLFIALAVGYAVFSAWACSSGLEADTMGKGSTGVGTGSTSASGGGASSTVGGGGEGLTEFTYADYCGMGQCVPEEMQGSPAPPDDPCLMLGAGGAGGADLDDCKLVYDELTQEVSGVCSVSGPSMDVCLTNADCAADYGCVDEDGSKVCRPYCCGALEDCPEQTTFCDLRPLADVPMTVTEPQLVPVCALVDDCTLLDDTTCAASGKTCTIVRTDGTTSCVTPGNGTLGQPCAPTGHCAAGYVCSTGQNECLKLCHTASSTDCSPPEVPTEMKCQGGASIYPPGFGVCVEN